MARYPKKGSGVGVKEGSIRPSFNLYWKEEEIEQFMEDMKVRAKTDSRIAVWLGDHLFGKALQPVGNPDGSPLTISFDPVFNASPRETKADN